LPGRTPGGCRCDFLQPLKHIVGQFTTALIKVASNGGQLIATSHHPETIRKFSDDNILVLSRKSHLDPALSSRLADCGYTGDLIDAIILRY
jgi:hypothetical protein